MASIAGLTDIVAVRVRPGLPTLLIGGLLGTVGSVIVLVRWGARPYSSADEPALLQETRWAGDSGGVLQQSNRDDCDYVRDNGSPLLAHDEDYW